MNKDIRIATTYRHDRKRRKLLRLLGSDGVLALIDLWLAAAESRPDGKLRGWTEEDIADEANWHGDPSVFVAALIKCRLLDQNSGSEYSIHHWSSRQPWVAGSEDRSRTAAKNQLWRWVSQGVSGTHERKALSIWYRKIYLYKQGDTVSDVLAA
jgi:hypothetical protein